MKRRLVQSGTCVLNATGAGSVTMQPLPGWNWRIESLAVSTSTAVLVPIANVYIDGQEVDGTYTGNSDTSDTPHVVPGGSTLLVSWTGGDVGAIATVRVQGWDTDNLREI